MKKVSRVVGSAVSSLLLCGVWITQSHASDAQWSKTIERVTGSIVSIHMDQVRAFDTEGGASGQATGFVVDANLGLILTNRHVVTAGPVRALAVFQNREEVELQPVYRDPVHDFGFYRYDPSKLHFSKPVALPLYPQGAAVGREIRVIGNDAGEQISILAGTLARLDRQAPDYGAGNYNDSNTFYYQAASSTSGGSSGSPVIDVDGRVVALNAGGSNGAATSFYLPLDRAVRALDFIRQGAPVPRGTLQTLFEFSPYDELVRLGLDQKTEAIVRKQFPKQTGMLVVSYVQPGSAAQGQLEPGDILLTVDGRWVTTFLPLESYLDDHVGDLLDVEVWRGREPKRLRLPVTDLYGLMPDKYLNVGNAVLHTLSWQMAKHFNREVAGVFVASPGYVLSRSGIPRGAVITEAGGQKMSELRDFVNVIKDQPDNTQVMLRFVTLDEPRSSHVGFMYTDRRWFPTSECVRDDKRGIWPCIAWPEADRVAATPPVNVAPARYDDPVIGALAPSLVLVRFTMPYAISGTDGSGYYGTGLVIDAEHGLVLVDRNTVPVDLGDVRMVFQNAVEVPGRVIYLHPTHNLAVIAYDPASVQGLAVRSVTLDPTPLKPGQSVSLVGLSPQGKINHQLAKVSEIEPAYFAVSRTSRFRETNIELIELTENHDSFDGALVDSRGAVRATWSSFLTDQGQSNGQVMRGIPAEFAWETLQLVRHQSELRSIETEFLTVSVADALRMGLNEAWLAKLLAHQPERRQALVVARTVLGSTAANKLRVGDVLLAVDGNVVTRYREVELAVQKPSVHLTLLRENQLIEVEIPTVSLGGKDVNRVVSWAGTLLQAPFYSLLQQHAGSVDGVYVAFFAYGSPASHFRLWPGRTIVMVDDQPTPDMDAFMKVVSGRADRSSVRLKTIGANGDVDVITLTLDLHYWPTYELVREGDTWRRVAVQ